MMKKPELLKNLGHSHRIEWRPIFPLRLQSFRRSLRIIWMLAGSLSFQWRARSSRRPSIFVIVADIASERPGGFQTTWVTLESSGIKSVADLRGKTMGVASYGSTTDLLGRAILKRNGIDPDRDVKRIDVRFPVMEQALRKGEIAAGEMAAALLRCGQGTRWHSRLVHRQRNIAGRAVFRPGVHGRFHRQTS